MEHICNLIEKILIFGAGTGFGALLGAIGIAYAHAKAGDEKKDESKYRRPYTAYTREEDSDE